MLVAPRKLKHKRKMIAPQVDWLQRQMAVSHAHPQESGQWQGRQKFVEAAMWKFKIDLNQAEQVMDLACANWGADARISAPEIEKHKMRIQIEIIMASLWKKIIKDEEIIEKFVYEPNAIDEDTGERGVWVPRSKTVNGGMVKNLPLWMDLVKMYMPLVGIVDESNIQASDFEKWLVSLTESATTTEVDGSETKKTRVATAERKKMSGPNIPKLPLMSGQAAQEVLNRLAASRNKPTDLIDQSPLED